MATKVINVPTARRGGAAPSPWRALSKMMYHLSDIAQKERRFEKETERWKEQREALEAAQEKREERIARREETRYKEGVFAQRALLGDKLAATGQLLSEAPKGGGTPVFSATHPTDPKKSRHYYANPAWSTPQQQVILGKDRKTPIGLIQTYRGQMNVHFGKNAADYIWLPGETKKGKPTVHILNKKTGTVQDTGTPIPEYVISGRAKVGKQSWDSYAEFAQNVMEFVTEQYIQPRKTSYVGLWPSQQKELDRVRRGLQIYMAARENKEPGWWKTGNAWIELQEYLTHLYKMSAPVKAREGGERSEADILGEAGL